MKTKNYFFASANTGAGFVSYLDELNSDFTYIIKGGPGTGKSTMMKKIAKHFFDKGFSVENFYCSTDPSSLDAVKIVEKSISIVDGTSPHIVEPKIVGLTHKIVDNGSFINLDIAKNNADIEKLTNDKKLQFDMLYKNLAAAKKLDDINFDIRKQFCDMGAVQKKAKILFSKIKSLNPKGENRILFLDAINNQKLNIVKQNKFIVKTFLADRYESFLVFENLENFLKKSSIPYTKICDVLSPEKTAGILINKKYLFKNINFNLNLNKIIEKNNKIIKKIINLAENNIFQAKQIHKKIEGYYIQNIDFDGIEKLTQKVIEEIELR